MNCFNVERSPSVINSVRRLYVQFITSTSASSGHRGLHTRLLLQSVYDYKLMDQPNMNFNPYVHLTRLTKEEIKKYTLKNHKKKNTYKEDASTENSGGAIQHTQIQIKDEVEDPDVIEIKTEPEDQIIDITQGTTFSNYVEKDNGNKNICKICNATFDNFEETIVHKYLTHRSKLYICKVCNLQFVLEMHLYLHQAEHYNNPCMRNSSENPSEIQSYICRVCNVQFILGVHFYVHLAEHNHNPCMRNSSGNPSEIQSSSKSNLTINPSRNYKNSKSTSELAKKSCNTNTSVNLKQNVTNMITQSKIISSIKLDLDKKSNIGNVNSQRYVSPNIPNFNRNHKCKDCDKHFTTHRKLNIHQKEHEHQMICNKCHKKFVSKRNFEKHLLSHTNVVMSNGDSVSGKKIIKRTGVKKKKQNILPNKYSRKVKCNWCPKTITRCNMLRHIKNVHHHPNPINCIYCSMAFKDMASLRLHKSRIH